MLESPLVATNFLSAANAQVIFITPAIASAIDQFMIQQYHRVVTPYINPPVGDMCAHLKRDTSTRTKCFGTTTISNNE